MTATQAQVPQPGGPGNGTPPRSTERRKADVLDLLRTERHLWLATATDGPHLVPIAFLFDGTDLLMVTKNGTRSACNAQASARARAAIGSTTDVVIVEGEATLFDPRTVDTETATLLNRLPLRPDRVPGSVGIRLRPERVQAWRGMHEMAKRTVMRDGAWV